MQKLLKKNTCHVSSNIYFTKLLVLTLTIILLFSTIATSANAAIFENKKEENIEDTNSSENPDSSGLLNGGFKNSRLGQRLSSAKEKIKDFFNQDKKNDNEIEGSSRLLDGSRDHRLLGFLDDLLTFHTNYSGVEKNTSLGLFQTIKVDVDGAGGDDVSARVTVLPGFDFKTLSFTINFNLNIELLNGNSINQNGYLRTYAQLNFPGFLIKNLTDENVKFGYISENGEKIPSSCTVTYKLAPNILNPAKKPGHSFEIKPGNNDNNKISLFCDVLGWSFYATYDSYVKSSIKIQDPIGPYDREFSISTEEKTNVKFHHERISKKGKPVNVGFYIEDLPKNVEFTWKTKISILSSEKIELGYKKTSSQNVNILFYKELFNERKFNYFFVKYLPSEVSFIFSSFMLQGYLELNTGGESISQIGLYDDLFKPKIGVYLADLPSTNRIDFQFRLGLFRETEISFYSDTEGLSFNAFGSEISVLDSESSFDLQIKSQSNLDITIYFNLLKGRFEIDNKDPLELEAYFNFESDFLYASGNGHIEGSNEPFVLDLNGFVNGILVDDIDLGLGFEIKNGGGFTLHNFDIELEDAPVYILDSGNMIPGHSLMDMQFSIKNLIFERTTSSSREGVISFMPILPLRDLGWDELIDSVIIKTYVSKECVLSVDRLDFDLDLTEIAVPNVNITSPEDGSVVNNTASIEGTSGPGVNGHNVDYVEVKIGQDPWKKASKIGASWNNWMVEWDTTNYPGGNYVIKARSYDGSYYSPLDSITLKINGTGGSDDDDDDDIIDKPTISINPVIPPVSGVVTISGSTTPGEAGRPVELVQIQIADEPWMNLSGTTSWSYNWDSSSKPIARVIVKARCYDGVNYSNNESITLIIKNVDILENSIIFEIEKEKSTYVNISNLNINYKKTFLPKNGNVPDPMEVKFSWKSLEITSSTSSSKFSFVLDKNDHSVSTSRSSPGSKITLTDLHFEINNLDLSSVLPALKDVDSMLHVDRLIWDNTAATESGFYLNVGPIEDDGDGSLTISGEIELSSQLELFGFYFRLNNFSYAKPDLHLVGFTRFSFGMNVTIENVTWKISSDMSWGWINISGDGYISVDLNIKKEGSNELLFELSGVFYLEGENEGLVFSWETIDDIKYFTIDGAASIIVDNLKLHIRDIIKISNLSFEGKFEANLQQINNEGGKIWAGEVLAFLKLDGDGKGSIDLDFDIEKIGNLIPSMTIEGILDVDLDYGFDVEDGLLGVKVTFNETGAPSFEIVDGGGNAELDLSGYISLKDFLFNYPEKNIFVSWSNIEINGDIHPTIFLTKNKVKLRLDTETEDITIIKIENLVGSIPDFSGSLGYCSLSVGAAGFIEFLFDKNENNVLTIDAQAVLDLVIEDVYLVAPGIAASCKEIDLPIQASATGTIVFGEGFQIEGFAGAIGISGRIHILGLSIKSPQISAYLSANVYGNFNVAGNDQVIQVSGYAGGYLHISGGGFISTPAFGTLYIGGTLQLSGAASGSATIGIGNDNGGFTINGVSGYISGAVLADVSMTKGLTLFTEEQIDTFCSNTLNTIGNQLNDIIEAYNLSSFINSVINLIETGFVEPNSKDIIVTGSLDIGAQGFIYFTYTPGSLYVAGNLNGGASVKITGLELTFYDRWNIAALQEITILQGSLNFALSTSSKYFEIGVDGVVLGVDLIEFTDLQTNTKIDVDLGVAQFEDNSIRMEWTGALKNLKPDSLKFIFGGGQFTLGYIRINVNNEEVFYMDVGTISISGFIHVDEISYSDSKIDGFHVISNLDASVGIVSITLQDVFSFSLSVNGQLVGDLGAYWEKDTEGNLDSVTVTSNSGLDLEINIEIEVNGNHVYLSIPDISAGDFTIEWEKGSSLSIQSQSGFQGSIIQLKVNSDVVFSAFDFGISPNSDITVEWDYMDGNAKCVKATTSAGFNGYLSTIQLNSQTILDINVEMSSGSSLEYRDWHTFHDGLDWSKDFYFDGSITVTVCRITLNGEVVDISGTLTGDNARIARGGLDSDSNLIYLIQSSDSMSTVSDLSFSAQNVDLSGSVDWSGDLRSYFDLVWHEGQGTGKSFYFQSNNGFDGTTTLDVGNFHMVGSRTLESGDCSIAFDLDGGSSDIKQFFMDTTPNSFIQHINFEFCYGANDAIKILDVGNIWANGKWIHWDFIRIPPYYDDGGEIGKGSGDEQPTIQVTEDGGSSWDQIWPYGVQPPNADAGGPYSVDTGQPVTFDASNSSDPNGDVLQYRWDFDYTGPLDIFWDTSWLDDPVYEYSGYSQNGVYTVKLQVREKDTILKLKDNDTTTVTVSDLDEMNVDIQFVGNELYEFEDYTVHVTDATTGDTLQGATVYIRTYDGDGNIDHEEQGITDGNGDAFFTAIEVPYEDPFDYITCEANVTMLGYNQKAVYFNVHDTTGTLHGWVIDPHTGEGIGGAVVSTDVGGYSVTTLEYGAQVGRYEMEVEEGTYVLTATHDEYLTNSTDPITVSRGDWTNIDIPMDIDNAAPVAVISGSYYVDIGENVVFDPWSSYDPDSPDDEIVEQRWLWSGTPGSGWSIDWIPFDADTQTEVPSHVYQDPGDHTACLQVKDSYGWESNIATVTVHVSDDSSWKSPDTSSYTLYWADRTKAYDENDDSYAYYHNPTDTGWSNKPLRLNLNSKISCDGFRFKAKKYDHLEMVRVELFDGDDLKFSQDYSSWEIRWYWSNFNIGTVSGIDRADIYFKLESGYTFGGLDPHWACVYEFDFKKVSSDSNAYIHKYVYDSDTSQPIASASVSTSGTSDTTNSTGYYSLTVSPGSHTVTASKTGYISQSQTVSVSAGQTVSLNFYLDPEPTIGTLHGWVYDSQTNDGIGLATVETDVGGYSATTLEYGIQVGRYEMDVDPGTYYLTASHSDYQSDTIGPIVVDSGDYLQNDIYLDPNVAAPQVSTLTESGVGTTYVTLRGKIDNDGGESCQVRFRYRELGTSTWLYPSNWGGSYSTGQTFSEYLNGLTPDETYEYQAGAKNSATSGTWDTSSEQFTTEPNTGTIKGYVYANSGDPLYNAYVYTNTGGYSDYTSSSGYYSMTVEAGSYSVTASKTNYQSETSGTIYVNAGDIKTQNFYLSANAWLYGFVYDEFGDPLGGAKVQLDTGEYVYTLSYGVQKGRYDFGSDDISVGTYDITASKSSYVSHTEYNHQINPGGNSLDFYLDEELSNPSVSTQAATEVTAAGAKLNGYLNGLGGASSCQVWFVYDTTSHSNYQYYSSSTTHQTKFSTGSFYQTISGLSANTNYYFRAVAQNSQGTVQGLEEEFTTSTCFLAGTKITMADDTIKNIEDIKKGEMVKSFDQVNQEVTSGKVVQIFHHIEPEDMADSYLVINNMLKVTSNHPIFVNNEWVEAGNIKIGDKLNDIHGSTIIVKSIIQKHEKVPTYNIEVETYHTYFAENILVHNKPSPGWIRPDVALDTTGWYNENNARDTSTTSYSHYYKIGDDGYTDYALTLTFNSLVSCDQIKIKARKITQLQYMTVKLYDGSNLKETCFFTSWDDQVYRYDSFTTTQINKVKITFTLNSGFGYGVYQPRVYDFQVYRV